jgi:VWFA-related protein
MKQQRHRGRSLDALLISLPLFLLFTVSASANSEVRLSRDRTPDAADYKGLVDLVVDPGMNVAKVSIVVDGDRITDALHSPYRVTVDLGSRVIQHKVSVTAWTGEKKHVQWSETINEGHLPLTVKLRALDAAKGAFEAVATAPDDDPIAKVEAWNNGAVVASATQPPYLLTVPAATISGFVQVTAKTKSGEEAADFWSSAGEVDVDNVDVRTVPLYVTVVDGNGTTRDDIDRSLFRVMDGNAEGKILQFSKAFDQPISIALLLDASASMTYSMRDATRAALGFVQRTLKDGDRCSVYAIREVPKREVDLTTDKAQISSALRSIQPQGQTALFDAIDTAIRDLKSEKNRRAIVILTDGGDNDSFASWDDLDRSAREAGIPIYFLAYENDEPTAQKDFDRMQYLATETGGFVAAASPSNLEAKYREIEKDLRAQFAIVYQVTDYAKHNEWRRVHVVLKSPKLIARTIGGYFAP